MKGFSMAPQQDPVDQFFNAQQVKNEEARAVAKELATVLLDPAFDQKRFSQLLERLEDLGYDHEAVVKCMLSRFAMHEALGDNGDYYDRWLEGMKRLEVPIHAISRAVEEAQGLRTELKGLPRKVISQKVYERYFGDADPPGTEEEMVALFSRSEEAISEI